MSDEEALSHPPPEPPEAKEPLQGGQVYIGNSNTRSAVMQVHLHRFQQSLNANHAGLAAVAAWLSLGDHHWAALMGCAIGCLYSANLGRLWIDLIQDTVTNLNFWNEQLNALVLELGIKDYLSPQTIVTRPAPKVRSNRLYRPLKQCTVAWVALSVVTTYQLFGKREEIKEWMLPWWQILQSHLP